MTEIVLSASQIMIDPALQIRPVEQAWNRRLEEAAQQKHDLRPLLVAKMGDHYILIGGHHRLEVWKRHLKTDDPKVRCVVVLWTNFKDMLLLAIADNRHGKPLTEGQLTDMYHRLLKEGCTREEAQKVLGLADARVDRIIEEQRRESEPRDQSQSSGQNEPAIRSRPRVPSEPLKQSHTLPESEPREKSHPTVLSEPMCESQPDLLSEPSRTSQPRTPSEPEAMSQPSPRSEPEAMSHPKAVSVFPSPDDNAILSHVSGLCRRKGYRANQFTQQTLEGLKIWIEEALS